MWKEASVLRRKVFSLFSTCCSPKDPRHESGAASLCCSRSFCPSVHRCWDHEYVAVSSYFCAAMISNEEKSDCKPLHMEMEVFVMDQECRWDTQKMWVFPVLPKWAQLLQMCKYTAKPHCIRTPKRSCCSDFSILRCSSAKLVQIFVWVLVFQPRIGEFDMSN